MVKQFLFTAICALLSVIGRSQILEFHDIERMPATVNSTAEEALPLLSPDGQKLFFARAFYVSNVGGLYAGQDIWVSDRERNQWRRATNDLSINSKRNNVVVGFSAMGKSLFYTDASPFQRASGIYAAPVSVSRKKIHSELYRIPGIENLDFIGFHVSPDLDVIFLSMKAPDGSGNEDLYYSVKSVIGEWSVPRSVGNTINSSGYEIAPFLSADKKRLYFASNGHGGLGDSDIFYSERLYDSWETWSVPVNLGDQINSKRFDAYFSIYGDTIAFFASNRDSELTDIYSATVIKKRTILTSGQRYITGAEWDALVGKNVSAVFTFSKGDSDLSGAQRELLFYIVNKLMLTRDIRFHLLVRAEEDSVKSGERLSEVYDALKKLGIDASRIYNEQTAEIQKTNKGIVELKLFR